MVHVRWLKGGVADPTPLRVEYLPEGAGLVRVVKEVRAEWEAEEEIWVEMVQRIVDTIEEN